MWIVLNNKHCLLLLCSQSDLSDGSDPGKLVQLLPNFDVWVNKMNLQIVLNEAPSRKDAAALFVLRRIIPLVFAWEELACSRGQGLNCKTTDDMYGKVPLDPTKVAACKGCSLNARISLLML